MKCCQERGRGREKRREGNWRGGERREGKGKEEEGREGKGRELEGPDISSVFE